MQNVESRFHAMEEDFAFGGQEHLLLAAVEETEAEQVFEFLDSDGDVWLRDFELCRRARQIAQPGRHAEILKLPQLHGDSFHFAHTLSCRMAGCSGCSFLLPSGSRQGIYLYIHKYNIYILAMP